MVESKILMTAVKTGLPTYRYIDTFVRQCARCRCPLLETKDTVIIVMVT